MVFGPDEHGPEHRGPHIANQRDAPRTSERGRADRHRPTPQTFMSVVASSRRERPRIGADVGRFAMVPLSLLIDAGVSGTAIKLFGILFAKYVDRTTLEGAAFREDLRRDLGVDAKSTVDRAAGELRRAGFLDIERRRALRSRQGELTSSVYKLRLTPSRLRLVPAPNTPDGDGGRRADAPTPRRADAPAYPEGSRQRATEVPRFAKAKRRRAGTSTKPENRAAYRVLKAIVSELARPGRKRSRLDEGLKSILGSQIATLLKEGYPEDEIRHHAIELALAEDWSRDATRLTHLAARIHDAYKRTRPGVGHQYVDVAGTCLHCDGPAGVHVPPPIDTRAEHEIRRDRELVAAGA